MNPLSAAAREAGLRQDLSRTQMIMLGLGGAIGTGLFLGSGIAIGYAGPAVVLSYAIAGFIALTLVFSLSEMAVMHPSAGSFGTYAETYLHPWAGFVVRYTYWLAQVIAIGGEAVAAGVYMTYWFTDVPLWLWSLGFAAVLLFVNSRAVGNFATAEFWFALIKVVTIVLFIILGGAALLGLHGEPVGTRNLTGLPGGFMPHGLHGVWMAVIVGIFSFTGIEVIAVASAEAREPQRAVPAALRTLALRLFLFYILALGIIVSIVPWTQTGAKVVAESPFVRVFTHFGISHAAGIMNFVVLSAALSSMNTNLYLCSRMLFSLSRARYAPAFLGRLNHSGAPLAATLTSGVFILLAAAVSTLTPYAYTYLFGVALFGAITTWMIILLSHLAFRRHHRAASLPLRMPWFPVMQIAGLSLLAAILITMGLDREFWNISWIVGIPWLLSISIIYFIWQGRRTPATARALQAESKPAAAEVPAAASSAPQPTRRRQHGDLQR